MMKNNIESNIFKYETVEELSEEFLMFGGCEFVNDFGPFKKGDKANTVSISWESSRLESHDQEGNIIHGCGIKLSPA